MRKYRWLRMLLVAAMLLSMFSATAFASQISATKNAEVNPDTLTNQFYPGDTIHYTMTVTNPIENPATNTLTRIWDTLPNGTVIEFLTGGATLVQAPGESVTFYTDYVVDWDDADWSADQGKYIVSNQFEATGYDSGDDDVYARVNRNSEVLPFLSLGDFVWNDMNRNGIQDPGELGYDGVTVNLWSAVDGNPGVVIETTVTAGGGFYLFDELVTGQYFVQFVKPAGDWAFTLQNVGNDALDSDANPATGISSLINLTADDMTVDAGIYLLDYELTVSKTVETTYVREHEWAIDKWITTENGDDILFEDELIPKIWLTHDTNPDETATWHVKVTYVGYEDMGFNVSGAVTITNTGEVDATISSVADLLAGAPVTVDFGVTFPYLLPVGQTLVGTYDEDVASMVTGTNDVTVTTDRQLTYGDSETIIWGAPASELLDEVNIEDDSDLFGVVPLGMLDAADYTAGGSFTWTYTNNFDYDDYTTPGPHMYYNTAIIVETQQTASAVLDVNWVPNEELLVTKTAVPTFTRTHEWDIDKKVETENGHLLDGIPKIWLYADGSGNETATWTVDINYMGYTDSDFNVAGTITITNTGNVATEILNVQDFIDGMPISVVGPALPLTLGVGESVAFTYSATLLDKTAEMNTATVTTDETTYGGNAPINWGAPTIENLTTVNVTDISDLFGTVDLGTVTAPNDGQFKYTEDFAWTDYTAPGPYVYDNTATIVETQQSADARLKVNWVGTEELTVTKTAVPTYTRTHAWEIDKRVETENGLTIDENTPKIWLYDDGSGDETATWYVDVTYKGYTDSGFNVTGTITVENTGDLDAVITSVSDLVGGVSATITGGPARPLTLAPGGIATFTYSAALTDKTATLNTVTVTTEEDTYTGEKSFTWGAPTTEPFKVVDIVDVSSKFGTEPLGTLNAAALTVDEVTTFTYNSHFAWADYSFADHEEMVITNTATIVQTGQHASAILKINWIPREDYEGLTPGFWKNHTDQWVGYTDDMLVGSVFAIPSGLTELADDTLLEALNYGGGRGALGAARSLLRAAVAAILNAEHPEITYPVTTAEIIADVNAALASMDKDEMEMLKNELDMWNNLGGGIDAHGNPY